MARQPKFGPYNYERILGTRNYKATATVTAFVAETTKRMQALALQATTELIEEVQTPKAKGGRMPVDTGFLRASGQLSLSGLPSGPTIGEKDKKYATKDLGIVELAGFTLGQTIFFGWTANYAKYREAYDGFLISGIQNWQTIVDRVCKQIAARSPASKGK